eukprot:gb/GECH01005751.1/.p1 GENE.gb/GECH01005751.1/~~gb/GECH01005751.1/.p1  ORF type:complete len:594 (+),score=134.25 gb/GECH01005751.1/:1-1782(+)
MCPFKYLSILLLALAVFFLLQWRARAECDPSERTFDGYCNNLERPGEGISGELLARPYGIRPDDQLPNARRLSNTFFAEKPFKLSSFYTLEERRQGLSPDPKQRNVLINGFHQLVGHDASLVRHNNMPQCFATNSCFKYAPIPDPNDPLYMTTQEYPFLSMDRTQLFVPRGSQKNVSGTLTSVNDQSSFLDGSVFYGPNAEVADKLRQHEDGKLKVRTDVGDQELGELPDSKVIDVPNQCSQFGPFGMASGDPRTETNSVLASLHTLFVREHNYHATRLKQDHPEWNDEELFQEARKWTIAIYQHIIFDEFIPAQFGLWESFQEIGFYKGYDPETNISLSSVFASSANRIPHDQVNLPMLVLFENGTAPQLPGTEGFPDIERINCIGDEYWVWGSDAILRGNVQQSAQKFDGKVVDDMRSFPARSSTALPYNFDIEVMNILRERENGIVSYYEMRKTLLNEDLYDMPGCSDEPTQDPIQCFLYISNNATLASDLQSEYQKVNRVEFVIGSSVESQRTSTEFPLLGAKLWLRHLENVRRGDRFWYENLNNGLFSWYELVQIKKTSMADLLRRNTNLHEDEIPNSAFHVPSWYFN